MNELVKQKTFEAAVRRVEIAKNNLAEAQRDLQEIVDGICQTAKGILAPNGKRKGAAGGSV